MTDTVTETARLKRQVSTPEAQHAFLTITMLEGDQIATHRWPVEAAGGVDLAAHAAEMQAETQFAAGLSAYVLEVNTPECDELFDENPDPVEVMQAWKAGYRVERGSRGWRFVKPNSDPDAESFGTATDAWIAAGEDSALWLADHATPAGSGFRFAHRELATVLAALRTFQRLGSEETIEENEIANGGHTFDALLIAEIDALCERLSAA